MLQKLRGDSKGFTLIELMIVVAIIAIIAAVAYPNYTQFVTRSKRTVGATALLQVADRQQQFFRCANRGTRRSVHTEFVGNQCVGG